MKKQAVQTNMFEYEDTPLFSGVAPTVTVNEFRPSPVVVQTEMFPQAWEEKKEVLKRSKKSLPDGGLFDL